MSRTLCHRLTNLVALASLQALLLSGTALAQGNVQMFEEPPPMALLRSIMVPESQPGLTRRIIITQPDQSGSMATEAVSRGPSTEPAPTSGSRRQRWQQPAMDASPVLASARQSEPAAMPEARPVANPAPAPAAVGSVGFHINFALNSDVMPQSAFSFVERIAELLRDQPQVKLQVEGHTDALGSDDYNLQLSQRRAIAVATYLVERQGVDPARLLVVGRGEEVPLTDNAFDPRNRRVQFARVE